MSRRYKETARYLNEDRRYEPKETHKFIRDIAADLFSPDEPIHLADIGCAAGDFLFHVHETCAAWELSGFDIREDFLQAARDKLPDSQFGILDITKEPDTAFAAAFDIVTLIGVHSRFDSPDEWLETLLSYVKPDGAAIIFGPFNRHGVDVQIRYRPPGETGEFFSGWNLLALDTLAACAEKLGYQARVEPFAINLDLEPVLEAPARSWTFKLEDGSRMLTNGLQLLLTHHAAVLQRSNK